ncbi:putative aldouronate transport system permease protein [Butyrivibrio hungatei DSM 14810]|uniref:Sugar ABC transporter permease protein n=2 Tax=Butyrivibrio hungatei TaxID=185008 RepID=A0A1D9P408_9FIRM|nr:carbohydrate ABC transporter permease [Butyrivibrio hungatei]AOZ97074.1 sugar ABC transporter permease protein [Butyrivibrio hungatei]SHN49875.1 putative aldouronate transport system permease protein [Butyrivibrio hungatei DSM 14810]
MRRVSFSRKIFVVINTIFLVSLALLCVLPLINLLAISFSGKAAANSGIVTFWPVDPTILAYQKTLQNSNFVRSLEISFARTILGTLLSMFVITTAGYALSKDFRGRTPLMWFFVFTMLFGGGLIPSYMVNTSLGLKNNFLVYILPGAFSCYNLILIMNFFRSIPKALEEAALIDGASFFDVLLKIFLPLSKAGLATVALFTMVGHWNEWFTGILYMSDTKNYPLASFLQVIVVQGNQQDLALDPTSAAAMSERTIKASQIFIGVLPILLVYPFLQKYFVKGMIVGAVKE